MARSQETFNKKEREKNKQKKRREKEEKKEQRKADGKKSSFEDMIAYVDEFGRITSVPPDQRKKQEVNLEDVQIGIPRDRDLEPVDTVHTGKVSFFNESKGYGFIRDDKTQESIFVHTKALNFVPREKDKVSFEVEKTPRGKAAVRVSKIA